MDRFNIVFPVITFVIGNIVTIIGFWVSSKISKESTRIEVFKMKKEVIDLIQLYFTNSYNKDNLKENSTLYHKIFSYVLLLFDDDILNKFEKFRNNADKLCASNGEYVFNDDEYYKSYRELFFAIKRFKNKLNK